jgi:hypothetical protein
MSRVMTRVIALLTSFLSIQAVAWCQQQQEPAPVTISLDQISHDQTLEAVQIVQDSSGSVPLIANRATLIRAYLSSTAQSRLRVIGAALSISPASGGDPLPPLANLYIVNDGLSLEDKRARLSESLNFLLPADRAVEGTLKASLVLLAVRDEHNKPRSFICTNCDASSSFTFRKSVALTFHLVSFSYKNPKTGNLISPDSNDLAAVKSWLAHALPVATDSISYVIHTATLTDTPEITTCIKNHWKDIDKDHLCCQYVNEQLLGFRKNDQSTARAYYYGLVFQDPDGNYIRGCANVIPLSYDTDAVATGPAGPTPSAYCRDATSYAGCYAIHEVGHLFGRRHPGACPDEKREDARFPFENGQLSPPNDYVGFDIGASDYKDMRVIPGAAGHDMMTYCYHPWPSAYTLRALLRTFECQTSPSKPECNLNSAAFIDNSLGPERQTQLANLTSAPNVGTLSSAGPRSITESPVPSQDLSSGEGPTLIEKKADSAVGTLSHSANLLASTRVVDNSQSVGAGAGTQQVAATAPMTIPVVEVARQGSGAQHDLATAPLDTGPVIQTTCVAAAPMPEDATKGTVSTTSAGTNLDAHGINVIAAVDATDKSARIVSITPLLHPPAIQPASEQSSPIRVVTRRKDGSELCSRVASIRVASESTATDRGLISVDLPTSSDVASLDVMIGERVVARRTFTDSLADFKLDDLSPPRENSQAGPSELARTVSLSWHLAREDVGKGITFSVLRSDDGGKTWQTLAVGLEGENVILPAPAGGKESAYRIVATNGLISKVKTVTPKAPN